MHRTKRALFTVITCKLILVACFALGELAVRLFYKTQLEIQRDERSLTYRYDELLGWFPKESNQQKFTGYRTISVKHNSYGFRDHEYQIKDKPRIAFLGDSFVWGFDAEEDERFTNKLQKLIPQWEVLNLGVSGYGTDQEFLLLKKWHPIIQPNIVFLVYTAGSDDLDNLKKINFHRYFKPYFTVTDEILTLKGVPVPKGADYLFQDYPVLFSSYFVRGLIRAIDNIRAWDGLNRSTNPTIYILRERNEDLRSKNTQFAIGFHGYTSIPFGDKERQFCDHIGIPCIDLSTQLVYPGTGNHWTPQGHDLVAQRIYKFLHQ
ncbi:MAG: hypothetical protein ACI906_002334 [Candidatus Latescibacterota bacterium]|jgi:hypothetical protein